MLYRTHLLGGVAAGLVLAGNFDTMLTAVGITCAASLLPDIDSPHSKLGRLVPFISWPLNATIGHRGPLHSLFGAAAFCLILMVVSLFWHPINTGIVLVFFAGYISHLVLDSFNPSGVPWLWPLKTHFKVPLVQTGSVLERLVIMPFMLVSCNYLVWPVFTDKLFGFLSSLTYINRFFK